VPQAAAAAAAGKAPPGPAAWPCAGPARSAAALLSDSRQ